MTSSRVPASRLPRPSALSSTNHRSATFPGIRQAARQGSLAVRITERRLSLRVHAAVDGRIDVAVGRHGPGASTLAVRMSAISAGRVIGARWLVLRLSTSKGLVGARASASAIMQSCAVGGRTRSCVVRM
jgi:hypothetical protein